MKREPADPNPEQRREDRRDVRGMDWNRNGELDTGRGERRRDGWDDDIARYLTRTRKR